MLTRQQSFESTIVDQGMNQHLEKRLQHHIQRDIIRHLLVVPSARFSELKPKAMESNLFMYHLKALMSEGFVSKSDDGYELTSQGKHFADRANLDSLAVRVQPKLITILCIQREDGAWLLLERLHQPVLHFRGFPSGKIHYGESLQDAAERELDEKAGLHGIALQLRGNFIMRFMENEEVVNHISGYVFSGSAPSSLADEKKSEYFRSYWGPEGDLFGENTFKGHQELLQLLDENKTGSMFLSQHDFLSDY